MNTKAIDAIATAVLYEGYMLYPYRSSSVKNRQRFSFGVLYPRAYSEAQSGSDAWSLQTEFLVQAESSPAVEVRVRFLKLIARSVGKPIACHPPNDLPDFEPAPELEVDGRLFRPWLEATECEVAVPACDLDELTTAPLEWKFAFPARQETELLWDANHRVAGMVARKQESVEGTVEIRAARASRELFKVHVMAKNDSLSRDDAGQLDRDSALMRSLVSAHIVLGVRDGQFISLLEPPEDLKGFAMSCQNIGAWPVLVGGEGERDTMLSSPIILYDYPQIAPESPGDLFDGTEIDEILALRIMTMTDDEKREMRNIDERARRMLERTEALSAEHLMQLHGTVRELRSLRKEMP
jgi:hydrogenase maturation protease